jgi:GntR family transcriptional regulator
MWQKTRPIYVQIRDLIASAIINGTYGVGDSLPSVRALAVDQQVNPLTVSKAYQELQLAGLVTARRGLGLFVEPGARERLIAEERKLFIESEWPAIRRHIDLLGLKPAELFDTATA